MNRILSRLALSAVVIASLPLAASAQPEYRYGYISTASNEMMANAARAEGSPAGAAEVTGTACLAVRTLRRDRNFIDEVMRASESGIEERERFANDVYQFVEVFLQAELTILRNAGLSPRSIAKIMDVATSFKDTLNSPPGWGAVLELLGIFESRLCNAADRLRDMEDARQRRELYGKLSWGVLAVAMCAADAAVAPPTLGVSNASLSICGGILSTLVFDLLDGGERD